MTVFQVRSIFFAFADHHLAEGTRPEGDPIEWCWYWYRERERELAKAKRRPRHRRPLSRAA
jgi:hypothetical protein